MANRALADNSKPFMLFYSKENGPKFGPQNNKEEPKCYKPYEHGVNDLFVVSTETVAPIGGFFYVLDECLAREDKICRFVDL
jgi:hypothetical protein